MRYALVSLADKSMHSHAACGAFDPGTVWPRKKIDKQLAVSLNRSEVGLDRSNLPNLFSR